MIKGFKGFNKNLQCTPGNKTFQYEIGKDYEDKNGAKCCEYGFHFCEYPLDVFGYYPPSDSRYCSVEGDDIIDKEDCGDSKIATSRIKISAEIGLPGLIKAGVEYIKSEVDWGNARESNTGARSAAINTGIRSAAINTGYRSAAINAGAQSTASNTGYQSTAISAGVRSAAINTGARSAATNTGPRSAAINTGYQSAATNTGVRSVATNTGDQSAAINTGCRSVASNTGDQSAAINTGCRSVASNTGDQSAATVEGKESIAIATGIEGKAKGIKGCYLVLAEWVMDDNYEWNLKNVKSVKVDGDVIKENAFYTLKNDEFVEVE